MEEMDCGEGFEEGDERRCLKKCQEKQGFLVFLRRVLERWVVLWIPISRYPLQNCRLRVSFEYLKVFCAGAESRNGSQGPKF